MLIYRQSYGFKQLFTLNNNNLCLHTVIQYTGYGTKLCLMVRLCSRMLYDCKEKKKTQLQKKQRTRRHIKILTTVLKNK